MTPPKPLKPRKRLDYLLELIAKLEEEDYYFVKTLLEQAAKADPPDSGTPRWEIWHEIFDDVERRRAREPSG